MKIADMILVITFAVGLVLVLWYLFGSSPTIEQVIVGLLIANLGWTYANSERLAKMDSKLNRHLGEHEGYQKAKEDKNN